MLARACASEAGPLNKTEGALSLELRSCSPCLFSEAALGPQGSGRRIDFCDRRHLAR